MADVQLLFDKSCKKKKKKYIYIYKTETNLPK